MRCVNNVSRETLHINSNSNKHVLWKKKNNGLNKKNGEKDLSMFHVKHR